MEVPVGSFGRNIVADRYKRDKIRFTLNLYKLSYIPRSGVDKIQLHIKAELGEFSSTGVIDKLALILFETKFPFKDLQTEKLRFNIYESNCSLQRPIKLTIRNSGKDSAIEKSGR